MTGAGATEIPTQEELERGLFPGRALPGGGQIDVRIELSDKQTDPDILQVARRLKSYDADSWFREWTAVAERNEALAIGFEEQRRTVTAHEFYRRAVQFYRQALLYMPQGDPRMLPAFNKLSEVFEKTWSLAPPPFERVRVPYEGHLLEGLFYAPRNRAAGPFPVIFNYAGSDGMIFRDDHGAADQYVRRGMAYLDLDGPGHGGALRLAKLYAPPDAERVARAVLDYLETRPEVDPGRIGVHGSSMAGYAAPRCATGEHRIKAVAVWSGVFDLKRDLFDFHPAIQERLRWVIGAKDLAEARDKIAEFTLEGRADKIQCPLLVGYGRADRFMDPRGALELYERAVNSPNRSMVDGVGHGYKLFERRTFIADWFREQLVAR